MGDYVLLVAAVVTLGTAIIGYLRLSRSQQEIHVMVNSRLEAEQDWNDQLSAALQEAGIRVPPRPPRPK